MYYDLQKIRNHKQNKQTYKKENGYNISSISKKMDVTELNQYIILKNMSYPTIEEYLRSY